MPETECAIGIFDSGVGGLTVYRQLLEQLPHESLLYLGDTARVPYGTKSPETVIRYAEACAALLLKRDIKLLVVACNTASAHALPTLQKNLDVPVIGVVTPGAQAAVQATQNGRIGVIATTGTINSGAYQNAIHALLPDAQVFTTACPLFVPLVEEGWTTGEIPEQVAQRYLAPLMEHDIDTLVLGCTHYPLLKPVIQAVMGEKVRLIDSAEATAACVCAALAEKHLRSSGSNPPLHRFLVSDSPHKFAEVGEHFLGLQPETVEWVDF